ncbi:MAG: hypothetical protein H7Y08_09465, partial [Rhizobiaceae bacterium]|nr:hypothetical protein [Rhizobiaceae bacterium]
MMDTVRLQGDLASAGATDTGASGAPRTALDGPSLDSFTGRQEKSGGGKATADALGASFLVAPSGAETPLFARSDRPRETTRRDARFEAILKAVHADATERERHLVLVASRLDPAVAAAAIFPDGSLYGHDPARVPTLGGLLDWLADAADDAVPERGRVVVIEASFEEAANGQGFGALFQDDVGKAEERVEVERRLVAADCRVIVAMTFQGSAARVLDEMAGVYILPWLDVWLRRLKKRFSDISLREIQETFGADLHSLCKGASNRGRQPELELFIGLDDLLTGDGLDAEVLFEALEETITTARNGRSDRGRQARETISRIFDESQNSGSGGEIGKTLFALRVLAPSQPFADILWLCSRLLPSGEAPVEILPRTMRDRWQRELADARQAEVRVPGPPSWGAVFDHDPDRYVRVAGLQVTDAKVELAGIFRQTDPAAVLTSSHSGFLTALLERIGERRLYRAASPQQRDSLVVLHLSLARALGRIGFATKADPTNLDAVAMATALADLAPDGEEFRIEPDLSGMAMAYLAGNGLPLPTTLSALEELLQRLSSEREALERMAKAAERPQDEADPPAGLVVVAVASAEIANLVETLRYDAARRLEQSLSAVALRVGESGDMAGLVDALIACLARLLPHDTLWVFLGFHLLYGSGSSPEAFARADLFPALGALGAKRSGMERKRKEIWAKVLDAADTTVATRGPGHMTPAVERWPDGLRAIASQKLYRTELPVDAMATVAEDFFTQYSISWNFRGLDDQAPPALAVRLLLQGGSAEEEAPDLLVRLMTRVPRHWIGDLKRYEIYAAGGERAAEAQPDKLPFRAADHVFTRLGDVLAVLLGGLDREARRRGDDVGIVERSEVAAFSALSSQLSIGGISSLAGARAAVMAAAERDAAGLGADALELLGLYPLAVFAEWRFRLFGTGPIERGSPEYDGHLAVLKRIHRAV